MRRSVPARILTGARRLLRAHGSASVVRAVPRLVRIAKWGLILAGAVLLWGGGIEPRLIDEEWESARLPGLPQEWKGARVALIADLQVGMWLANTDTARRVVRRLVEARPAAVLIAGDFLYHPNEERGEPREARAEVEPEDRTGLQAQVAEVASILRPLTAAGLTTVAVLGNHDYAMQWPDSLPSSIAASELTAALRGIGVIVLRNDAVPLGQRDAHLPLRKRLHIAGLDATFPQASDVPEVLRQLPGEAPRVWVMHNPLEFRKLPAGTAPVALAAHTHGGQVRLPFTDRWSWMSIVKESPIAAEGWIPADFGASGNRLYVNRGIGFSVAPIRINCPPELTWLTLEEAE